jgi:hypothetical protein
MFKNQTPRELAFLIASVSAAAIALLLLVVKALGPLNITWPEVFGLFALAFAVGFLANFYLVRYFIFRRIKLIYKIIHREKLPSGFKAANMDMSQSVLDDVEKEVDQWAQQNEKRPRKSWNGSPLTAAVLSAMSHTS